MLNFVLSHLHPVSVSQILWIVVWATFMMFITSHDYVTKTIVAGREQMILWSDADGNRSEVIGGIYTTKKVRNWRKGFKLFVIITTVGIGGFAIGIPQLFN